MFKIVFFVLILTLSKVLSATQALENPQTHLLRHAPIYEAKITLPYPGAQSLYYSQKDWNQSEISFTYTCFDAKKEFWGGQTWYKETRRAVAMETGDKSKTFFYSALPSNVHAFSDHCNEIGPNIDEFKNAISVSKNIQFYNDYIISAPFTNDVVKAGECLHHLLGQGSWKAHFYSFNGQTHILLTITYDNEDNGQFFALCKQMLR